MAPNTTLNPFIVHENPFIEITVYINFRLRRKLPISAYGAINHITLYIDVKLTDH